mmetsp:Transcript_3744/g.7467  ORF Transcript_3744/g.7467 Transcript_3744/m.7467 type:complete len:88 (-) Transcript_3744:182-445(-)
MDLPGQDPKNAEAWEAVKLLPAPYQIQWQMFSRGPIHTIAQEFAVDHRQELQEMRAKKDAEMRAWWEAEQKRQAEAAKAASAEAASH